MELSINQLETPFYFYEEEVLLKSIQRFKDISYENTRIYAATMANNNREILKILLENDIGVFVNSKPHLDKVIDCGFKGSDIIYTSTAIKKDIMEELIQENVIINIDSLKQLDLYGSLNPGGKIGIRLNVAEFFLGEISESVNNRIGICEDEFDEVYEIAEKYGLTVNGLHVYLGSDIINYDYMKESVVKTIEVSKKIKDLEYIDFGGGFPVQGMHGKYFDYQGYDKFITAQLNDLSAFFDRSIELIIEPGRSLFGESAAFYTSIIDIKERHDQILICCDSSASMFPRSLFYGEYHEVEALNTDEEKTYDKPMSVVGHTTYSRDYLVKNEENFRVQQEGNRLKFLHAGSYCYSMLTNFLGQEVPTEWLLTKENKVICIDDSKKEAVHAS